ncbi:MAG: MarR family winged helix-turn-helix transcriptional regulator [Halothiobacillaceae bacterium]
MIIDENFDICSEDRLPVLLVRVTQLWRQRVDAELAHHGLSQAKWQTLATLSLHPEGMIQSELAETLGVEGPSLVAMIDRLSRDHWVERNACSSDRRCKIIRLTERAMPLIDDIRKISEKVYADLLDGTTADEMKVTEHFLRRLRDKLAAEKVRRKRRG